MLVPYGGVGQSVDLKEGAAANAVYEKQLGTEEVLKLQCAFKNHDSLLFKWMWR